jgi:MSHA biogenesis protein MshQ
VSNFLRITSSIILLIFWVLFSSTNLAFAVTLNSGGGTNASNGLRTIIDQNTQIQVFSSGSGQLYSPSASPSSSNLDNGIYMRANGTVYGPDHFQYNAAGTYSTTSITAVSPTTASAGVVQTTTSKFTLPNSSTLVAGPQVQIDWSYTYPYTFVTASVTITIPLLYPVSSSNPVRYYHAVDTYLGGSDCGCGVRYVDSNGHQVAGTYPLTGYSCSSGGSTSTTCPTSTSLPPNLDVVETFRERNGSFSHYCVGSWSTFWSNSTSDACAIGKSTTLADTVNTKLMDTGAAIEYDFTSPGTYTFSYDFVVGSTAVPNYDHLEIQHGGSATLCPTNVQVLACTSSTVPCPAANIISTGVLTGSLTTTPSIPNVTQTPASFQVGADGASVATVSLQADSAGIVVFGATGLTKTPQNGVKCWNTATSSQGCSFTFTNTPCVATFDCIESSQVTYNNLKTTSERNPLYTKVVGQNIDMDIVAVLANGDKSSGYNSTLGLTVELMVENSAGTCGTSADVVARKLLVPFSTSDNGRKKVTFTASDFSLLGLQQGAYPNLRCKVTDPALGKSGCSSDNFALRPSSFTITSGNVTTLPSPGPSLSTPLKAWTDNFNLKAVTGETNYSGTPKIYAGRVVNHDGNATVGKFGYGVPIPTASPPYVPPVVTSFPASVSGVSNGNSFLYSEVGFFRFNQYSVYDETFAAVDRDKGDCNNDDIASSGFTSFNNDNVKNGCRFGNTAATGFFGRFIPDHFRIAVGSVSKACTTFIYYSQDTASTAGLAIPFTVYAENANNGEVTTYYTGVPSSSAYAKFIPSVWNNFNFTTTPSLTTGTELKASASNPALPTGWTNGQVFVDARFKIDRPSSGAQVPPQTIAVTTVIKDSDNVATNTSPYILASGAKFLYGRLTIPPVHGSELLPLPFQIEAQYWVGGSNLNAYARSGEDNCTTITNLSTIVMTNYKPNLNACETILTGSSTTFNGGVLKASLSAPKIGSDGLPNTGSVDLKVNLSTAATTTPPETTCLSATASTATSGAIPWFGTNPVGRATFGIYKAPIIYMRENF